MEIDDEVEITITVRIIPKGDAWKSGLLQTTKHLQLPIHLLDYDKLTNYIYELKQEIEHGLQTTS